MIRRRRGPAQRRAVRGGQVGRAAGWNIDRIAPPERFHEAHEHPHGGFLRERRGAPDGTGLVVDAQPSRMRSCSKAMSPSTLNASALVASSSDRAPSGRLGLRLVLQLFAEEASELSVEAPLREIPLREGELLLDEPDHARRVSSRRPRLAQSGRRRRVARIRVERREVALESRRPCLPALRASGPREATARPSLPACRRLPRERSSIAAIAACASPVTSRR